MSDGDRLNEIRARFDGVYYGERGSAYYLREDAADAFAWLIAEVEALRSDVDRLEGGCGDPECGFCG